MKTGLKKADEDVWRLLAVQDVGMVRFALGQIIGVGLRILGADEGSLLVAEPDDGSLCFAMVAGPDGAMPHGKTGESILGKKVPIGEGVTGMAALTHDVQTAADADGAGMSFHRVRGDGRPHAVLAAPMLLGEELIGVITAVSFDKRKTFSSAQAETYGMLANVAATVVEQQRRLERVATRGGRTAAAQGSASGGDEEILVEKVLAIVRRHPQRIAAVKAILAALEDLA